MQDTLRIARAVTTNQLARLAPSLYVRATRQTGRGAQDSETPEQIAAYFRQCVDDYFAVLGVSAPEIAQYLRGKTVLEYGPGDFPGVALVLVAFGAEKVYCVDRFPLLAVTAKNSRVLDRLIAGLPENARERLLRCFVSPGTPESGFATDRIEYLIRPSGLSGLVDRIDLVISRAVLEHVNNLAGTFHDMTCAMRQDALAVHQVDLKSHGLHRKNPLDFLVPSPRLWSLMYSHKGVPNRWRVDRYRDIVRRLGVEVVKLECTLLAQPRDVAAVRSSLAEPFLGISDEDLAWLGFWLVFRKGSA